MVNDEAKVLALNPYSNQLNTNEYVVMLLRLVVSCLVLKIKNNLVEIEVK